MYLYATISTTLQKAQAEAEPTPRNDAGTGSSAGGGGSWLPGLRQAQRLLLRAVAVASTIEAVAQLGRLGCASVAPALLQSVMRLLLLLLHVTHCSLYYSCLFLSFFVCLPACLSTCLPTCLLVSVVILRLTEMIGLTPPDSTQAYGRQGLVLLVCYEAFSGGLLTTLIFTYAFHD